MQKKFHIYPFVILSDLITLLLFGALLYYNYIAANNIHLTAILLLTVAFLLYNFIKHATYTLEITQDTITEKSLFTKKRSIKTSSVNKVTRGFYSFITQSRIDENKNFFAKILLLVYTKGKVNPFYGITLISLNKNFPAAPVSKKFITALYKLRPNISFHEDIVDFVPKHIRKKLNITLSVTDIAGLWIWRFCISILALFIVAIIFMAIIRVAMNFIV